MELRQFVQLWFEKWEEGDYRNLPVTADFTHTSPFGTVQGRARYIRLVQTNEDQFLGYRFEIHDELYSADTACVRYIARSGEYSLEASEWFFGNPNGINRIISYYDVGGAASYQDPDE